MLEEDDPFVLWLEWLRAASLVNHLIDSQVWDDMKDGLQVLNNRPALEQWIAERNYYSGLFYDRNDPAGIAPVTDQAVADVQLNVFINLAASDSDITDGVMAYVRVYRLGKGIDSPKRGRPAFVARPAKYRLASKPDVKALRTTLNVWNAIQAAPKDEPLWKTALGLISELGIAQRWRNTEDGPDKRKELGSIMSRYRKRAEDLIEGVAHGIFPAP